MRIICLPWISVKKPNINKKHICLYSFELRIPKKNGNKTNTNNKAIQIILDTLRAGGGGMGVDCCESVTSHFLSSSVDSNFCCFVSNSMYILLYISRNSRILNGLVYNFTYNGHITQGGVGGSHKPYSKIKSRAKDKKLPPPQQNAMGSSVFFVITRLQVVWEAWRHLKN